MNWVCEFSEDVQKDLQDLPKAIQKRVARVLTQMAADPFQGNVKVEKESNAIIEPWRLSSIHSSRNELQLFDLANLVEQVFASAGLEYRIVGGLATYLYVEEVEPDAGRLTTDIDI